ncbi:hypothetical protein [Streptomyces roseochromogenus]|uniref:Uncharacterized protein n=1 Tax=Streptomyces roseochromogenus subsp. oscitans DS 12.976 TaxID=1352936 RepID=V6K9Z4_STRRC|nr:hypothetical protein [Streptomyces roseochromogenus]EST25794.1 hypothetical protein M878_28070 [Streptomyces roseochromogenus subsp. oscitans DS 12.976]
MGLYDRIMSATNDPTNVLKVNSAAQGAARLATQTGHSGLAVAAAAGAALFAAVDTVMHAPKATDGPYATFSTDDRPRGS